MRQFGTEADVLAIIECCRVLLIGTHHAVATFFAGAIFGPCFIWAGITRMKMLREQGIIALIWGVIGIALGLGSIGYMVWMFMCAATEPPL